MKLESFKGVVNGGEFDFYFRGDSVADRGVIQQIFVNEDYRISHWVQGRSLIDYYLNKKNEGVIGLIVDAGANIGASSVYFSKSYPASVVLAIEPERSNSSLLRVNVDKLNVSVVDAAIGCECCTMFLQDPGQGDWAYRVGEVGDLSVKVISPVEVMSLVKDQNTCPLIFKVDIEGGESNLFRDNFEWVDSFPLIIIELHDWMLPFQGTSRYFFKAITAYDFDFVYRGENIFCFNRRILNPSSV